MSTQLPSLLTLCGFLLPAAVLLYRRRPRSAGLIAQTLLIALFCLFGGLLFSAAVMALTGISAPLLTSTLVVLGALLCVAGQQWWQLSQTGTGRG